MDIHAHDNFYLTTNTPELYTQLMEVGHLFHEFIIHAHYNLQVHGNHIKSEIALQHILPNNFNKQATVVSVMRQNGCSATTEMTNSIKGHYIQEIDLDLPLNNTENGSKAEVLERKRQIKRFAKLSFYKALQKQTGKSLPWGALTGIRPTRLAYQFIERGKNFRQELQNLHVQQQNIDLVERILQVQQPHYQKQKQQKATDLYISIPFCPTRCNYCSFITAPIAKTGQYLIEYLQKLQLELQNISGTYNKLSSIYIGGGTPLLLEASQLKQLLTAVQPLINDEIEYTVEAGRPDVFTDEKLQILQDFKVNRICINPQTFSDKTLQKIGRAHTVQDILNATKMAKKYNFICNFDLIAGLTDESVQEFCHSVDTAIALQPENITIHTLSIKKGADLQLKNGVFVNRKSNQVEEMLHYARKKLLEAGYLPYYMYRQKYTMADGENIGWCKGNTACIYNIHMMEEIADTVACGANAISKVIFNDNDRIERYATPKDIPTYLAKIDKIIADKKALFDQKKQE